MLISVKLSKQFAGDDAFCSVRTAVKTPRVHPVYSSRGTCKEPRDAAQWLIYLELRREVKWNLLPGEKQQRNKCCRRWRPPGSNQGGETSTEALTVAAVDVKLPKKLLNSLHRNSWTDSPHTGDAHILVLYGFIYCFSFTQICFEN